MDGDRILEKAAHKMIEEVKKRNTSNASSKASEPTWKMYNELAYISSMERTRCFMLIDKLKAISDLLEAQTKYYEAVSLIERDNEMFGFDLSI